MATIDAICTALRTRLLTMQSAEPRLQVITEMNSEVVPPAILIDTPEDSTPTNLPETEFTDLFNLIVVVPFTDQKQAQTEIRKYLSSSGDLSVRACLMADKTLGGVVHGLQIRSHGGVTAEPVDLEEQRTLVGSRIPVEIDH